MMELMSLILMNLLLPKETKLPKAYLGPFNFLQQIPKVPFDRNIMFPRL